MYFPGVCHALEIDFWAITFFQKTITNGILCKNDPFPPISFQNWSKIKSWSPCGSWLLVPWPSDAKLWHGGSVANSDLIISHRKYQLFKWRSRSLEGWYQMFCPWMESGGQEGRSRYTVYNHEYVWLFPRGVDLLGNLPGCVCRKVREMGSFSTWNEGIEGPSKWV